jgi:heme exporter protein D
LSSSIIAFASTKHVWFDTIPAGDKALFWTNVAVAAGTLALAVVTVASVLETRAVIRGEDRRHQQSFAPMLQLEWRERSGANTFPFALANKGMGMAINAITRVQGTAFGSRLEKEGDPPILSQVRVSKEFAGTYKASQVALDGEVIFAVVIEAAEVKGHREGYGDAHPKLVLIEYEDMFGNIYKTSYADWQDKRDDFVWEQPKALKGTGLTA